MRNLISFIRGYLSCRRMLAKADPVLIQSFNSMSGDIVEREEFLLELSSGKKVIHFGFLDSIFLEKKLADGSLLHGRLSRVTSSLVGVDIDAQVLAQYRRLTGDHNNLLWDIADGEIPSELKQGFDLVLFPEVLEHVPNPGLVLENLHKLCMVSRAKLCLTVPNGFDMYSFMAAMHGVELIHPDHCYTFTPHTISRLLRLTGFKILKQVFYNFGSTLAPGITKAGMVLLAEPHEAEILR